MKTSLFGLLFGAVVGLELNHIPPMPDIDQIQTDEVITVIFRFFWKIIFTFVKVKNFIVFIFQVSFTIKLFVKLFTSDVLDCVLSSLYQIYLFAI